MSRLITIGSDGREVGRSLAEKLNISYYDNEIVLELEKANKTRLENKLTVCRRDTRFRERK